LIPRFSFFVVATIAEVDGLSSCCCVLFVRCAGFASPEEHVRRSTKSIHALARSSREMSTQVFFSGEAEFSVSTVGLLALLSQWASSRSTRDGSEDLRQKSLQLLNILVDRIVGERSFVMQTMPGPTEVKIQGKNVFIDDWKHQWEHLGRARWLRGDSMSLVELMVHLCHYQQHSVRVSNELQDEATKYLKCTIRALAIIFEFKAPFGGKDQHMQLQALRLASGKCRRISQGHKVALRQVTSSAEGLHSSKQLLSASRAIKRARGECEGDDFSPKHSKGFSRDHMYQYMLSSQKAFSRGGHINVCCDGTRVDDDDLCSYLFYDPLKQLGCWGPPQVTGCSPIFLQNLSRKFGNHEMGGRLFQGFRGGTFFPTIYYIVEQLWIFLRTNWEDVSFSGMTSTIGAR